jgi:hypothetical protein
LPTWALKVLISGKPEISGPRPGMTRHMIRISKSMLGVIAHAARRRHVRAA